LRTLLASSRTCLPRPVRYFRRLKRRSPSVAGVVFHHSCSGFSGLFTQILLVDHTFFGDEERHDSRVSVFSWISENCEAAGQVSVHQVVFRAALCFVALLSQYPVEVSVKRLRLPAGTGVAGCLRE